MCTMECSLVKKIDKLDKQVDRLKQIISQFNWVNCILSINLN